MRRVTLRPAELYGIVLIYAFGKLRFTGDEGICKFPSRFIFIVIIIIIITFFVTK